jgi:hypothetical protein
MRNSYEVLEYLGRETFGQIVKCWKKKELMKLLQLKS